MVKKLFLSILLAVSLNADPVVNSVVEIESNGNVYAVGDNGRSVGPMQIQKIAVRDVNRILGEKRFSYDDRFCSEKSAEMFYIYTYYYTRYDRLGRQRTLQDIVRVWNGGPNGYRKASTRKYWKKFKEAYQNS